MYARSRRIGVLLLSMSLTMLAGCGDDDPVAPSGGGGPTPLSFDTFQAATLAIGQPDLASGDVNAGGSTNAMGLASTYCAPARGSLYVPDQGNARVLGFASVPTASGAGADFVLGQPDFTSNTGGVAANKFSGPICCTVAGGKLFLVDINNNRVLIWNSLPTSDTPADVVVGQADFTSNTANATQDGLSQPVKVFVSGGKLFVADAVNNRVLIWNSIPTSNGAPADVVVGQPDFTTATAGLSATAFGIPRGLWVGGGKLVVADDNNDRVLIWNSIPTANGEPADVVVGAPDFTTAGSNTPSATSIGSPMGVAGDGQNLYVADAGFHRVLVYPFPTENGAAATQVLGQTNFTLSAGDDPNQDGVSEGVVSARTFGESGLSPNEITIIGRQLFVADYGNSRIMVFTSTD